MIQQSGDGYKVVSEEGKPLSKTLPSRAAAEKRLAQVEYFKHDKKKNGEAEGNLTDDDAVSEANTIAGLGQLARKGTKACEAHGKADCNECDDGEREMEGFNPDQERDEHGRFASGGGSDDGNNEGLSDEEYEYAKKAYPELFTPEARAARADPEGAAKAVADRHLDELRARGEGLIDLGKKSAEKSSKAATALGGIVGKIEKLAKAAGQSIEKYIIDHPEGLSDWKTLDDPKRRLWYLKGEAERSMEGAADIAGTVVAANEEREYVRDEQGRFASTGGGGERAEPPWKSSGDKPINPKADEKKAGAEFKAENPYAQTLRDQFGPKYDDLMRQRYPGQYPKDWEKRFNAEGDPIDPTGNVIGKSREPGQKEPGKVGRVAAFLGRIEERAKAAGLSLEKFIGTHPELVEEAVLVGHWVEESEGADEAGKTTAPISDYHLDKFRDETEKKTALSKAMAPGRESAAPSQTSPSQSKPRLAPPRDGAFTTFQPLREVAGGFNAKGNGSARVILITEGPGNKSHRNYYPAASLRESYAVFEGKKCFLNHPSVSEEHDRPERDVREICGWFSEAALMSVNGLAAVAATLNFTGNGAGQEARALIESALAYQRTYPSEVLIGLSINASGPSHQELIDGESWNWVDGITSALSCDLVTFPARGGRIMELRETDPALMQGRIDLLQDLQKRARAAADSHDPKMQAEFYQAIEPYLEEALTMAIRDKEEADDIAAQPDPMDAQQMGDPEQQGDEMANDQEAGIGPVSGSMSGLGQIAAGGGTPNIGRAKMGPDFGAGLKGPPNFSRSKIGGDAGGIQPIPRQINRTAGAIGNAQSLLGTENEQGADNLLTGEEPSDYNDGGDLESRMASAEADGFAKYAHGEPDGDEQQAPPQGAPQKSAPPWAQKQQAPQQQQAPPQQQSPAAPARAQPQSPAQAPPPAQGSPQQQPIDPQELMRRRASAHGDNFMRYAGPQQSEGTIMAADNKMTCEACGHEQAMPAPTAPAAPMPSMQATESARGAKAGNMLREGAVNPRTPLAEAERQELVTLRAQARQRDLLERAAKAINEAAATGYLKPEELAEFQESQWPILLPRLIGPPINYGTGEIPMPAHMRERIAVESPRAIFRQRMGLADADA